MRTTALLFLALSALVGCAPFPELDAVGPETSAPPQLLPIDDLIRQGQVAPADPGPPLAARAARLKARAAALKAAPPQT